MDVDGPTSSPAKEVGTVLATITDGVAQATVTAGNGSSTIAVSAAPSVDRQVIGRLVSAALDEAAAHVNGEVHWWVQAATADDDALAAELGLTPGRRLLQLERPLPTGIPVEIETRPFRPGVDEEAWLRQNNRSFADHPEQGGWTAATLAHHEAEPWFDPAGFLLHERDGRLAGSCWTKLHPATDADPELGEIYVIGVDPDYHGMGLGPQLTLAGLASIADRGVTTGMLFVDAANTPAVKMYEKLGFAPVREDRAYVS
ncbi:MAG: mycothiol synthase, partial [Ilumatobacteraceae bacterium]